MALFYFLIGASVLLLGLAKQAAGGMVVCDYFWIFDGRGLHAWFRW